MTPNENEKQILEAKGKMGGSIYELGQSLVECEKKCHFTGHGAKTFTEYIESKKIGLSSSFAFQCMAIFRWAEKNQLHTVELKELGYSRARLGVLVGYERAKTLSWKELQEEYKKHRAVVRKRITTEPEIEQWRPAWLFPMSVYKVWQEVRAVYIKKEGQAKDETINEHIWADWLAGIHATDKKTMQERMRDLWEWWKTIRYPKVDSKIADQNYTRYARTLQKLAVIEKAEEDRGIGTDGLKKGITAIFEWYQAFSKEKGLNTVDFTKVVGRYADYKNDPSQFEIKEEKDFNPATRKHKKEGESG